MCAVAWRIVASPSNEYALLYMSICLSRALYGRYSALYIKTLPDVVIMMHDTGKASRSLAGLPRCQHMESMLSSRGGKPIVPLLPLPFPAASPPARINEMTLRVVLAAMRWDSSLRLD